MVNTINSDSNQSKSILTHQSIEIDTGVGINEVLRIINKKVLVRLGSKYHTELLSEYKGINSDDTIKTMVDSIIQGIMINEVNIPNDIISQEELVVLKQEIEQEVLLELYPEFSSYKELEEHFYKKGELDKNIKSLESEIELNNKKILALSENKELTLQELNLREQVKNLYILLNLSPELLNNEEFYDLLLELKSVKFNLLNIDNEEDEQRIYQEIQTSDFFKTLLKGVLPYKIAKTIESAIETIELCITFIEYIRINTIYKESLRKREHTSPVLQKRMALVESADGNEENDRFIQGYYKNPYSGKTIQEIVDMWNKRERNADKLEVLKEHEGFLASKLEELEENKKNTSLVETPIEETNNIDSINTSHNIDAIIDQGQNYIREELQGKIHTKTNIKKITDYVISTLKFSGDTKEILPFLIIDFVDISKINIFKLLNILDGNANLDIFAELIHAHDKYLEIDLQDHKGMKEIWDSGYEVWHIFTDKKYKLNTKGNLNIGQNLTIQTSKKCTLSSKTIRNFCDKYLELDGLPLKQRTHLKNGNYYVIFENKGGKTKTIKNIKLKDNNNQYILNEETITQLDPNLSYEEVISVLENKRTQRVKEIIRETFDSNDSNISNIDEKITLENPQLTLSEILEQNEENGESNEELIDKIEGFFQFIQDKYRDLSLGKNILEQDTHVSLIYIILSGDEELFKKYFSKSYNSKLSSIGYEQLLQEKKSSLEKRIFKKFLGEDFCIKGYENVDFSELKILLSAENNNQNRA